MMQNATEQNNIQEYDIQQGQVGPGETLQSTLPQIEREESVEHSISPALPTRDATPVTPLDQTVAFALLGHDPAAKTAALHALRNVVGTLDTAVERKQKVDVLTAQLLREIRAVRMRARQRLAWKIAIAIFFLALFLFTKGHMLNYWWLFVGGGGAVAADERAGKRREAVHALYMAKEPRTVGVLAIAARDGDYAVQRVADQALRDLLPHVRASDANYIDAEQMKAILNIAEQGNAHMQTAVLKALQQIGDQRAIPIVEHLSVSGRTTAVRKLALESLPFLTERVRLAHEQATLLRGAASPTVTEAPLQLLRPASASPETPADQLLRPTSS